MSNRSQAEELSRELEALQVAFDAAFREARSSLEAVRAELEDGEHSPEQRLESARKLLGELLKKFPRIAEGADDEPG